MPLIALSVVVQLLCAVHCVRHGRNNMWLMVIIFLSIPGCLAYAFFEILPGFAGRREVRAAKSAALRKLDPERDLRAAREALELADTAANRIRLGDALAELGSHAEAVPHYEAALSKTIGGDRGTQIKLARAELEAGHPERALEVLEALQPSGSQGENDRSTLLLARAAQESGDPERALTLYEEVGQRLPGGEAQCRHAMLLISAGRGSEAVPLLEEVRRLAKRLDRFERAQHAEMYAWADRTLAELRGVQPGG